MDYLKLEIPPAKTRTIHSTPDMTVFGGGVSAAAASLCAVVIGLMTGCSTGDRQGDYQQPLGLGHVIIHIGHMPDPAQEKVVLSDGSETFVWSKDPYKSAAEAMRLFVKDIDDEILDSEGFEESARLPGDSGRSERVIVERDRSLDGLARMFRVQLFRKDGLWIPEWIWICHGDPDRRDR